MQILEIINMLPNPHLRIRSLMALLTSIVIMDDITSKPLTIIPYIATYFLGG